MRVRPAVLIWILSIGLVPAAARAQWQPDGVALSRAIYTQDSAAIVPDGAGGAIVTWRDARIGSNYDIYAQRVNSSGVPQWTADGVAVCVAGGSQFLATIVSDGAGGAIIAWQDGRGTTFDVYAQRVSASGVPQWTDNGVALCTESNSDQLNPTIVSDGAGGAVVTWQDERSGFLDVNIYAQRVNASGAPQWTVDGVAVCTATNQQWLPTIASDGAGGAIVTWEDFRSGLSGFDIYARRVNASGTPQWTSNGVALCTATNLQQFPTIVSDGAGGAVVTWEDHRNGSTGIYARRVNASGAPQWVDNGIALCEAVDSLQLSKIASDGAGGALVTWFDYRSGTNYDIYAQRVTVSGAPQWTANGVALCTATNDQVDPTIVSDGAGGAIATWTDYRGGTTSDIYSQRVNASGARQWTTDGVVLSSAANDQLFPAIASNGTGGAIVTWEDRRSGLSDVYAQRVEADFGAWGTPEPLVTSVNDVPSDQGGKVAVNWKRSGHDVLPLQAISHYSIWRAVDPIATSSAASGGADGWVDPSSIGSDFRGPALSRERIGTVDYYWEWLANQNSTHGAGYSFAAPTREDSISGDVANHYFQVLAHTTNPYVLYKSNVLSGHSVDNLAPLAPLLLIAQRVGADVSLRWNRAVAPDLRDYSVYRATASGVTPVPVNFLASADDTVLVDASAPASALYYIVTAFDVHDNESAPSNEANVGATTGVGNTPPITALTVLDNAPNPFATTTTLRIGLPRVSEVEIEVFDVAGRSVRIKRTATLAVGWREVAFDARDASGVALPSGVYFYRVRAAGETITRKLVIAR